MNKKVLVLVAALLTVSLAARADDANRRDAGAPLTIHIISGSKEYQSESSLKKLQQHLQRHFQITCSASWARDGATTLENLDALADAELMLVFARRLKLSEGQMKVIRKHWEQGKPIVGIRTAGHAFEQADNDLFDRKILGGHYSGHYGGESVQVTNRAGAADHPVLAGVGAITSTKLYKAGPLADDTLVLQVGDNGKASHPVTIVHRYNGGRTFFTSLGVPSDFEDDDFLRMLENAFFWTTHRERGRMKKE